MKPSIIKRFSSCSNNSSNLSINSITNRSSHFNPKKPRLSFQAYRSYRKVYASKVILSSSPKRKIESRRTKMSRSILSIWTKKCSLNLLFRRKKKSRKVC